MPHFGLERFVPDTFYAAYLVAALLTIFWRPYVGLFLLVPLLPLQSLRYRLHDYPLGPLFVDVMILAVILGLKRARLPVFPKTPFNRMLAAFVGLTYVLLWRGTFYIGAPLPLTFDDRRLQDWKNYMIMFFLLFLVASAVRTVTHMKVLLVLMCLGVLILDKYYLGTVRERDFSQFSYDLRYAGAMGYAGVNGFAAFEAQFGTFLLAFAAVFRGLLARVGSYFILALNALCLLYALSRGGYAAFVFGWVYVGVKKQRLLLVVLLLFLVTWQGLVPVAVRERIFMTQGEDGIDHSAGSRLSLWQEALQVFNGDPLFGTGFNTYAYRINYGGYQDTHNLYVKILVETGAVGLGLFLVLLWKMYKAGVTLYKTADNSFLKALGFGFAALMAAAALANFFGDRWTYLQVSGYTWVLLGMVCRGQQIVEEGSAEHEELDETGEIETPVGAPA